jgi:hypothetical protein
MKSIKELKNPDIIEVNGEKLQVVKNTSLWHHNHKGLEMVVELVRPGRITLSNRITYFYDTPEEIKFFHFNRDTWEWEEQTVERAVF